MEMEERKELPTRKRLRLENYDYSSAGAYFITICIEERKRILSEIIAPAFAGDGALCIVQYDSIQVVQDDCIQFL